MCDIRLRLAQRFFGLFAVSDIEAVPGRPSSAIGE
jgi:hypothetical protein